MYSVVCEVDDGRDAIHVSLFLLFLLLRTIFTYLEGAMFY